MLPRFFFRSPFARNLSYYFLARYIFYSVAHCPVCTSLFSYSNIYLFLYVAHISVYIHLLYSVASFLDRPVVCPTVRQIRPGEKPTSAVDAGCAMQRTWLKRCVRRLRYVRYVQLLYGEEHIHACMRNKWDGGARTKRNIENMPTVADAVRGSLGESVW